MKKSERIPAQILSDVTTEVLSVWMDLRVRLVALRASGEWDSPSTDPLRLDLLAATLTQAVVSRINGLYPMYEVHLGPARDPVTGAPVPSLKTPNWEKKP